LSSGQLSVQGSRQSTTSTAHSVDSYAEEGAIPFGLILLALSTTLFVLALALRLPYLMEVPGFTDETVEMSVALNVLNGGRPLVDVEPYLGSLFNYLLAGIFLVWPQPIAGRLLVSLLGAITVVLAFFLARRLAGTLTALLTAGLMATSATHIANGHIAWTNCTTPFFTTAAMLALVEAKSRGSGRLMLLSGALYGLSLQTHPAVILLAPAFLLSVCWAPLGIDDRCASPRTSIGLRSRWPYLALLAALVCYANVVVYNLQNPGAWMEAARRSNYAYVSMPGPDSYLTNLQQLVGALIQMVASSFQGRLELGSAPDSQLLLNAPYLVALLIGVVYALRKNLLMPPAALLFAALLMPYFNKDYTFPMATRYLGFLLPLLYLLIAMPVAGALAWSWRRIRPVSALLGLVYLSMMLGPLAGLYGYYTGYLRDNATGPTILTLEAESRARYRAGLISEVLLDPQLEWVFTAPGGRALRAMDFFLTLEQVPHRTVNMAPDSVVAETDGVDRPVVLIASKASRERLGDRLGVITMEVEDRPYLRRDEYWGYLLPPRRPSPQPLSP
jgi:glycosyltransferase AglD